MCPPMAADAPAIPSPLYESTRPSVPRPRPRATSEPTYRLSAAVLATACSAPRRRTPTSCSDQSAAPASEAGTAAATPVPISTVAAGRRRGTASSSPADSQLPTGTWTMTGCRGWRSHVPWSRSFSPWGRSAALTARRAGSMTLSNVGTSATRSRIVMRLMAAPYPVAAPATPAGDRSRPPTVIEKTPNRQGDRAFSPMTRVTPWRSLDPASPSFERTVVTCPSLLRRRPEATDAVGDPARRPMHEVGTRTSVVPQRLRLDDTFAQFVRFVLVGGSSTAVYALLFISLEWLGYLPAHVLATVTSSVLVNEMHRRLTFRADERVGWLTAQIEAGGVSLFGLVTTSVALAWLDATVSTAPPVLQISLVVAVTAFIGLIRFIALRWIFRPTGVQAAQ